MPSMRRPLSQHRHASIFLSTPYQACAARLLTRIPRKMRTFKYLSDLTTRIRTDRHLTLISRIGLGRALFDTTALKQRLVRIGLSL